MSNPGELERVLREDGWLRRIARQLAGDVHAAEDLAQDAWVAALASGRADRPWLFGVLRNLRRREARRRRQAPDTWTELGRLARPDTAPATDEVVDELLLRKRVTDGLLELDEPYRTTLYLRYVQDLRLSAIARRSGVAVSTVHERLARGLELLRHRLDAHYDGRRRAWAIGLLSLAKPSGLALPIGGLVVGTSKAMAAVLILGGSILWWWAASAPDSRGAGSEVRGEAPPVERVAEELEPSSIGMPELVTERARTEIAEPAPAPEAAAPPLEPLRGRVLDLQGLPVASVRVGFEPPASGPAPEGDATTDGLGRFELPSRALDETPGLRCLEPDLVTLVHGLPQDDLRLVVVGRAASFAGVVEDPQGRPIAGAEVRFDLRQSLFRERGVVRPWSSAKDDRRTRTGPDGDFELAAVCGGEHVGLWVAAEGFQPRSIDLPPVDDSSLRIVLQPDTGERMLAGIVIDPLGQPVPGARVSAGLEIVRTDAEGGFHLSWRKAGAGNVERGDDGVFRPSHDTSILRAAKAGHLPAEVAVDTLDLGEPIVLRLGGPPPSIRGRLVDARGDPRSGVLVWAGGGTPFGGESRKSGDATTVWQIDLETVCRGESAPGCVTDDDGRFELGGLLPKEYAVRALDPATATQGGPWSLEARTPGPEVELVLATEPGTTRVAGRIVSAAGKPLADVWVVPRRGSSYGDGSQPPYREDLALGTRTDAEGRFEFQALATRGTTLELQHEAFFIRTWSLEGHDDLERLEIVEPVLCELQVELRDPAFADSIEVLDPEGQALEVLESWGAFLSAGQSASFADGKTSVLRIQETACTLVLRQDEQEVLRRPLRLDPGQRLELRL